MAGEIKIQGPLKFIGYLQTAEAGTNEQVLTYRNGDAVWSDGSVSLPTALPCFRVYSTIPIFTYSLSPIYRIGNTILCRDYVNPVVNTYISNAMVLDNNELPCRDFNSNDNTFTQNNITLR